MKIHGKFKGYTNIITCISVTNSHKLFKSASNNSYDYKSLIAIWPDLQHQLAKNECTNGFVGAQPYFFCYGYIISKFYVAFTKHYLK